MTLIVQVDDRNASQRTCYACQNSAAKRAHTCSRRTIKAAGLSPVSLALLQDVAHNYAKPAIDPLDDEDSEDLEG